MSCNHNRNRLRTIWYNMMQRCYNKSNQKYPRYGGRNITVCKEWENFNNFKEWSLSNGYDIQLTIDRIDNDGNYCPENCRWVSNKIQANNKSSNIIVAYKGIRGSLKYVCEQFNADYNLVRNRYSKLGWSIEDSIEIPKTKKTVNKRFITFEGEILRLYEWAKKIGITTHSLTNRLSSGWSIEKALTTGYRGKKL